MKKVNFPACPKSVIVPKGRLAEVDKNSYSAKLRQLLEVGGRIVAEMADDPIPISWQEAGE